MTSESKQQAYVIQLVEAPLFFKSEQDRVTFNAILRNLFEKGLGQVIVEESDVGSTLTLTSTTYPATVYEFFQDWLKNQMNIVDLYNKDLNPLTAILVVDQDEAVLKDQWFFTDVHPVSAVLSENKDSVLIKFGFRGEFRSPAIELFAEQVIGAIQSPLRSMQRVFNVLSEDQRRAVMDTALKATEPTPWEKLTHHLNAYDYPTEQIQMYGGIPTNMIYDYVSSSFLNGLVNYAGIKQAFLINRYGPDKGDQRLDTLWHTIDETLPYEEQYRLKAEHLAENSHLSKIGTIDSDDAVLFGETEFDWWIFYYDCDCSDCSVVRISKGSDWENDLGFKIDYQWIVEQYLADLKARYKGWQHCEDMPKAIFAEINKNGHFGWISS